ncbi:aldehyde dehydrogenase family protein [Dactylosporangium sp. NPDC005572]|uniref:aldehyde dehydrogenase family protein n=1 Tax=Dactylosporangium sp. NPDC005572 TaxID=3156889 RepID=UPI0033ABADF6
MTTVGPRPETAAASETFSSWSPATGTPVGTFPVHTAADVHATVERAQDAAQWWSSLGFTGRSERLAQWRKLFVHRQAQLIDLMRAETGKSLADARLEFVLALEHIAWAGKHARKVLRPQRRRAGLLMANQAATVEFQPLGVIGVIGPWNYPLLTPIGSIVYALAAGNAVVFKPSEHTPAVGRWLADTFAEVATEHPVFQTVTGFGPTGDALARSRVDKIAFTGSTATGKKIMAAAAEALTPLIIEAGGKDPLLVDADADVNAAAEATIWGAFTNAGQTCIGIERVYVHEQIYDEFVRKVTSLSRQIHAGEDYGPMTTPNQLDIVSTHITDALSQGGTALVGGADAVNDRYVQPTVLIDVPEDATAVQEETFGPTVTITKVADMDEAIRKANGTRYGLGAAVFSRARGVELARRLRTGMVSVNAPLSFAAIASLPYGGMGDSGFGRIHGEEGLREFTRAKSIARQRFAAPISLTTFQRSPRLDARVDAIIKLLYGR